MPCRKVGNQKICSGPRTDWWLDSMGIDWYSPGGGSEPDPVGFIMITDLSNTSIELTIEAVSGANNYVWERSTNADFSGATQVQSSSSLIHESTSLTGNTTYFYRVRAQNGNGFGGYRYKVVKTFTTMTNNLVNYAIGQDIDVPPAEYMHNFDKALARAITAGATGEYDCLYAFNGDYPEFSLLNIVSPGNSTSTLEGLVGGWTGTFTREGIGGDGSNAFVNIHFNPATQGVNYTQNDACVTFYTTNYGVQESTLLFGIRNSANTAQIVASLKSAAGGFTDDFLFIINDNTNSAVLGDANTRTRGLYFAERISSSQKRQWFRETLSSPITQNSVAIPSGDMYLLGRNDQFNGTVNAFSNDRLAFFGMGGVLTAAQKTAMRNFFVDVYLYAQNPLFRVDDIADVKVIYRNSGVGSTWDETSLFGQASYKDDNNDFDLFGATNDPDAGNPDDYSVGAFDFLSLFSGVKDINNPLIDIGDFSPWTALFPMDKLVIGSTIYWFFTVRDGSGNTDSCVTTTTISNPKALSTNPADWTIILNDGTNGQRFNHGMRIIRDHPDTDYWYATHAHRDTSADPIRINIVRCLRSADLENPSNWTTVHSNVIAVPYSAIAGQVYAWCFYDTANSNYKMFYGRFAGEQQDDSFTIFCTQSADLSSFPIGNEVLWPTGVTGDVDSQYTSLPTPDFDNGLIGYSTRDGGSETPYLARCLKYLVSNY